MQLSITIAIEYSAAHRVAYKLSHSRMLGVLDQPAAAPILKRIEGQVVVICFFLLEPCKYFNNWA
jgi:hypothetical protein